MPRGHSFLFFVRRIISVNNSKFSVGGYKKTQARWAASVVEIYRPPWFVFDFENYPYMSSPLGVCHILRWNCLVESSFSFVQMQIQYDKVHRAVMLNLKQFTSVRKDMLREPTFRPSHSRWTAGKAIAIDIRTIRM